MQKKLFLLDAYALIFRAYYAFIKNPRYNSKGLNTSAIFGFTNTLIEILNKEKPTHIAVVFDPPRPNFRHEMYSEYKANRSPTPEDIKLSVPYIKQIIESFNIPVIEVKGFEADDTIGTLAKKAEKKGFVTFMMTPDKDFSQLVSENIFMFKPKRSGNETEIVDVEAVNKKYNLKSPLQFIDILALWGDASDNIPGAPGIGEKTAKKLIEEFGSIETLFENIDKLKGKQKENIENNIEQIKLSKKLATININVPVELNETELAISALNKEKITEIFNELGFKTILPRVFRFEVSNTPVPTPKKEEVKAQTKLFGDDAQLDLFSAPVASNLESINTILHKYELIDTEEKTNELIAKLNQQKELCFDTETTGIDANNAELVGISFSFKEHEAYYIPIPENRDEAQVCINKFKQVLENGDIIKIGQNIKYDILMLKWYGIEVQGTLFDTMVAHYLLRPELRHNMNFLAEKYLDYLPVSIESLIGKKGKNQRSMRTVPLKDIVEYGAEDADITFQLKNILEKELKENDLFELFQNIEMPLVYVLAEMEKTGVNINSEELNIFAKKLKKDIDDLEKNIYKLSGTTFNISSPKQLGIVLFEKMKLPSTSKKTKSKQYSTSEDVLLKLKNDYEIVQQILDYRSLKKLLSTYAEALPRLINPKSGRIHTSFNQARVATGRLSSDNPNLQNIPIREERGREIRKSFVPASDNYIFYSADYSQVELRIMAHLSKDEGMITAFNNKEDIHQATAAKINKVQISDVTREMRSAAKSANFGIIYGISSFGLSQNLNITRSDAKKLIDSYFENYPKVKEYMDKSILVAREKGYVETIFKRRRILRDINSNNHFVRSVAERNAINAPIQGSAADIIKIAMIGIYKEFKKHDLKSKMIMQVHDELNFEVFKEEIDIVQKIVKQQMENAIKLDVPLTIDMGIGNSWFDAH